MIRAIAGALVGGAFAALAYTAEYRAVLGVVGRFDAFYVTAVCLISIGSALFAGVLGASPRFEGKGLLTAIGLTLVVGVYEACTFAVDGASGGELGITIVFLSGLRTVTAGQVRLSPESARLPQSARHGEIPIFARYTSSGTTPFPVGGVPHNGPPPAKEPKGGV